jgi:hypothetical protein
MLAFWDAVLAGSYAITTGSQPAFPPAERVATKVVRVRDGDFSPCQRGKDNATTPTKESSASGTTAFR